MFTEAEKRAARLAVSRFGVDLVHIQEVARAVLQEQAAGRPADLLAALVGRKLLTSAQADELRHAAMADLIIAVRKTPPPSVVPETRPGAEVEWSSLGGCRILRRLGEGGMGTVYLAYQETESRHVAIKVLADQLAGDPSYVQRFQREAGSATLLDHPNIVRGIAVGQDAATGRPFFVMEYVDGPSTHALLDQFGHLAVPDAVHVINDIARALEHAHAHRVIHRDIKPDNILLTRSGVAKLADLGLARRTDEISSLTGAQQGFGTPYYMPYEQTLNARKADSRSDIFALGATLYHLLTGEVPFPGRSALEIAELKERGEFILASKVQPDVPPALNGILARMLARKPRDRYQTASELLVDLERSALAAPVPSFVDRELALQDPLVRARLVTPQPTMPDLDSPRNKHRTTAGTPGLWYLRYRNREGRLCKLRATTEQLLQRIREKRIPDGAEASRQPQGEFLPLTAYVEFQEGTAANGKEPPTNDRDAPRRRFWFM
jgi:serine/threonine-protein kinase